MLVARIRKQTNKYICFFWHRTVRAVLLCRPLRGECASLHDPGLTIFHRGQGIAYTYIKGLCAWFPPLGPAAISAKMHVWYCVVWNACCTTSRMQHSGWSEQYHCWINCNRKIKTTSRSEKRVLPNQVGRSPPHNRVTPTPNTMWLISVSKVKAQAIKNWLTMEHGS